MITISNILDLEWPGAPEWSPDGGYLAATIHEDDGNTVLVGRPGSETWRIRPKGAHVAEFSWSPTRDELVCRTENGSVVIADPDERSVAELSRTPDGDSSLAWSPDGSKLAYYRDEKPCIRSVADGSERVFDAPKRGSFLRGERAFAWTADDQRSLLAYGFAERATKCVGVIDLDTGALIWRTRPDASSHSPVWLPDGRLLFERRRDYGTVRELVAADVADREAETVLFREKDRDTGALSRGSPQLSPDGTRLAVALPTDGYEHIHMINVTTGERTQLTEGCFEDKGLADSSPRWINEDRLAFASNRHDLGQRRIYQVSVDGEVSPLVETPGTNVEPRPSPDGRSLAYLHASSNRSPEIRFRDLGNNGVGSSNNAHSQITKSGVDEWASTPVQPEHVSFESDGLSINGYLLDPRRTDEVADDATDLPSVVYVHGGPMRQMREGFHPSRSYGLAYAFQQYLASKGYVGLFVNYRGGIGYGREFRAAIGENRGRVEMRDIALGAEYLRELEYTSDSVGMWGLSYGGYAALQLPGTHPDAFDVTVNLAGLADVKNYYEWATETKFPAVGSSTTTVMGDPLGNADRWKDASPVTHMEEYETPLYSFHGTDDRYVNVEQQNIVVNTLLEQDVAFEAEYYPGEGHVFSNRSTWERTFERIEAAFDEHLR